MNGCRLGACATGCAVSRAIVFHSITSFFSTKCDKIQRFRSGNSGFMALIVQKYGGTSVGSAERIKHVARRVARWRRAGPQIVVVVSAMSGETNRLLARAREIPAHPNPRELDVMVSTGEQATIALMSMALMGLGLQARRHTR